MTLNLILVGGIVVALLLSAWWLHRGGRRAERADAVEEAADVKDQQLDIAANAPRSGKEVAARIREKGGF